MANTRYIEIDSTYRNRNQWPNPGEFEVLIAQSGRKDKLNSQDPVSLAALLSNSWTYNSFDKKNNSLWISAKVSVIVSGLGCAGDNKTIIELESVDSDTFHTEENYYNGTVANNIGALIGPTGPAGATTITSRITSYVWLGKNSIGNDRIQITVDGFTKMTEDDTIIINDPTDITDPTNPFIFVPNGRTGFNAYPGCILYNETNNTYSTIIGYDSTTKLLKITDITGKNWTTNMTFSIRKQAPQSDLLNNNVASTYVFSLPTSFSDESDLYRNSYIKVGNQKSLINRYETLTGKAIGLL